MAKDRNGTAHDKNDDVVSAKDETEKPSKKSRSKSPQISPSESEDREDSKRRRSRRERSKSRRRRHRSRTDSDSVSEYESESESDLEYSDSEESEYSVSGSEDEEERRRRKRRREKRRRREEEEERERKRRKREKRKREERERERRKKRKEKEKKKKEKKERGKTGAVTDSWGKYGVIRETDMWNKRPEFTAWLAEVKQVNLESLANWEEKQMFKDFMEDHNTATFPSKKYYNLEAYHKRQMEKEIRRGSKKLKDMERTEFNDEEQRRQELLLEREKQKEEQVENLKRAMQSGMAQDMKEQARLREEMAYQYKLGNFEAAAAIQRRLDPDVAM